LPQLIPLNLFNITVEDQGCARGQLLHYQVRLAALFGKKVFILKQLTSVRLFLGRRMPDFYQVGQQQAQQFYDAELKPLLTEI
jgi:hypothetical protein